MAQAYLVSNVRGGRGGEDRGARVAKKKEKKKNRKEKERFQQHAAAGWPLVCRAFVWIRAEHYGII